MVQMPNTLSKIYLMGQRSKVVAIESDRWISEATPEIASDLRDEIIRRLDRSANGVPSTRITLSFLNGLFPDASAGFKLQLVSEDSTTVLGETDCIYPAASGSPEDLETVLDRAFNSVPGWVDAGDIWVLKDGDARAEPSTSLSYTLYFDHQLPQGLSLQGDASTCNGDVEFKIERDSAPSSRPIYHRLHNLPGGFPDVLITEPRSLGPLADDPQTRARQFIDSDPGEETPLGRAELMKLMALLVGSVEAGNNLFDLIELRYNDAKALAMQARHRPSVMVGKPGTWNEAARSSWMITVGSTYVGQFLRDANVEYRNSDDSVNQEVCGSGCGVCPSGTSDTRCSVPINQYLDLFRSTDYWISAGIGANCWSGSCNFQLDSDTLLDQNREIFSQFLPMQCGSVLALDQAHSGSGNPYWELGRVRPDLILRDLVTLMHPDLNIQEETTFFRLLPPPSNNEGLASCPRTKLPVTPKDGTVHVTSHFVVTMDSPAGIIGAPHFEVLEGLYSSGAHEIADKLGTHATDLEIAMANQAPSHLSFTIVLTARVRGCNDHACGVAVGQKMNDVGSKAIERASGVGWISVKQDSTVSTLVLDGDGDIIPLVDLVGTSSTAVTDSNDASDNLTNDLSSGAIAGIAVGVSLLFLISMFATYKIAYKEGVKVAHLDFANEKPEAPELPVA